MKQRKLGDEERTGCTLSLPESLYGDLRQHAFDNRESIAKIVQDAVEYYLEREKLEKVKAVKSKKGCDAEGFERFDFVPDGGRNQISIPAITVDRYGRCAFNAACVREYELVDYSYVTFLYDRRLKRMGVEFNKILPTKGARRMPTVAKNGCLSICVVRFYEYYGLNISKSVKYNIALEVRKPNDTVVLIIDLNEYTTGEEKHES